MNVHFLGCAGWIPDSNETSCFLVEHNDSLFMLDAGTGVSNIKYHLNVWNKYDTVNIILSHYHLDHIIGLIYLLPYLEQKKLVIYGPGYPVYVKSTYEYLNEFLQTAFFSRPLDKFCKSVKCYDYSGEDFCIEGVKIEVKRQIHSAPSYSLNIDNKLIYATDTSFNKDDWHNVPQNAVLLHECWDIEHNAAAKHSALKTLMSELPVDELAAVYLIHRNPQWTEQDYSAIRKIIKGTKFILPDDGLKITI